MVFRLGNSQEITYPRDLPGFKNLEGLTRLPYRPGSQEALLISFTIGGLFFASYLKPAFFVVKISCLLNNFNY
jgi:hypothetical protein